MNPADPKVLEVQERLRTLAEEGHPISRLGRDRGGPLPISQQRVYHHARRLRLPHNRAVVPNSPRENRILAMLGLGYTREQVCATFSIAASILDQIVARRREQA